MRLEDPTPLDEMIDIDLGTSEGADGIGIARVLEPSRVRFKVTRTLLP